MIALLKENKIKEYAEVDDTFQKESDEDTDDMTKVKTMHELMRSSIENISSLVAGNPKYDFTAKRDPDIILLGLGFLCSSVWAWLDVCAADIFSWNFVLFAICFVQFIYVTYQVRSVAFDREFQELYSALFQPLGISLTVYRKIVLCCDAEVITLEKEHCYAMQGKTPIDKLSLLVSGRIRVTVDGEFLHYIFPLQFLDSPEWDSLRPTEEGIFQVTLTAETDCRYVAWRRKKLYLLFAKHRFISRLFSILIGSDIAEKLYALNDRVHVGQGFRYDIRLPNFYHVALPETPPVRLSHHLQRGSPRHKPTGVTNCGSFLTPP
ncbi:Popeye domain-containing protein 3 [Willisornis vidua]|uniref:Popeye domain-containing protein 3 n=1 Tax=Willisornis vidua TaxID=1566151 RepID=A0ABQ9DFS8_9PASS|nr:Popeye domain-containing protein 3 [Willisornis vidua]